MPIVTTSNRKRPGRRPALPLAAAALIVAVAVAFLLLREGRAPARPRGGVPPPSGEGPASSGPRNGMTQPPQPATPEDEPPAPRQPSTEAQSASTLQPFNPSTPPEEEAEQHPPDPKPPELPPTALKMAAEQLLALVITANDDVELPPPPMGDERTLRHDLMIALTNDIVIFDDETPESQRMKEDVAEAKFHLKQVIDEGGTITQAIEEYRAWKRENIRMRNEVRAEYARLRTEATREEADAYLEEANKALEAEGVQPIVLGPPRRKKSVRNGDPPPPSKTQNPEETNP